MPAVNVLVESPVSDSIRVRQVSSMFDCPLAERSRVEWKGDLPVEADPWSVGLIVGPSGSGKSTIARAVFGGHVELAWAGRSVIDDFAAAHSV